MAPSIFNKEMKGVKFSCTAPASTAVCSSINTKSIVRSTVTACRSSIDYSPGIKPLSNIIPKVSSSSSNTPRTRKSLDHRLSTSPANSSRFLLDDATYLDVYSEFEPSLTLDDVFKKKPNNKPSMDAINNRTSLRSKSTSSATLNYFSPRLVKPMKENQEKSIVRCRKDHDLMMDTPRLIPSSKAVNNTTSMITTSDGDQVVVLRVSLHCKGCEGKVRKHISKMEGVKSFSIDFKAKKVTITGNVTPLGVLNSVSKVKNAQFWPSSPRLSTAF